MTSSSSIKVWPPRIGYLLLVLSGGVAIVMLALSVVRDITQLNSAKSDNIQWNLSQTEVEFLQFEMELERVLQEEGPDFRSLRQKFDIFFSRIRTLQQASAYSELRRLPEFATTLAVVSAYLNASVTFIDSDVGALQVALPVLKLQTAAISPDVRRLSLSGLNYFAEEADRRRSALFTTLIQLSIAVFGLIAALALLSFYLSVLNAQNVRRRTQVIEASERMNIVINTALDAVVVSDTSGWIMDFNSAAEQIFGYSADDAIGRNISELIVPEQYREAHRTGMARLRDTGEKQIVGCGRFKFEAKRANDEIFPIELAVETANTKDGEIFIAFLRDISSQVQAEVELVLARDRAMASEKAKTDFLATMSHELRTPLNGLLGNLTLLEETRLSTRQSRYIRNMQVSGKLLMSHISDVLDITKFDAGKLRLHPVDTNLSTLLQDIVDSQSIAAAGNGSTLEWGWVGPPLRWVHADQDRIQHILMNVVGNAIKFTKDGWISITVQASVVKEEESILCISVRDNGTGIDPELLPRIFDDFVTGDSSYDREVGGTGLGLGIAQRFVKALGGSIKVESTPGKGSEFRVSFPVRVIPEPEQRAEVSYMQSARKQAHVLLVEDNEINRLVALEMLTAQGHSVTEARNGRQAVKMADETAFDLILMDISMPEMDGRSAARAIRTGDGQSSHAPIIAVTANAMANEQEAFLADGMNGVLTKPLTRDSILQLVVEHVSGAHDGSEMRSQYLIELEETVGAEALKPLLNRFAAEMQALLQSLEKGLELVATDIAIDVHRISGSAATFGFTELHNALSELEKAVLSQEPHSAEEALNLIKDIWSSTKLML